MDAKWLGNHRTALIVRHGTVEDVLVRWRYLVDEATGTQAEGWARLTDAQAPATLAPGGVLRHPARLPYEHLVDLMVIERPDEGPRYGLLIATGLKSGLLRLQVPPQAEAAGGAGLTTHWVIEHWRHWIYLECFVEDVWVRRCHHPSMWPSQ